MSIRGMNRHVVVKANGILGQRWCMGCKRHQKLEAFDDDGPNCKVAKERRRKAHAAIRRGRVQANP